MTNLSQCTLEIDLAKIRANYQILVKCCQITSLAKVGAVVKANSYGLGAHHIAKLLQQEGCQHFFVASIDEGIELRTTLNNQASILVLNGVFDHQAAEFVRYNLTPVLNHLGQVKIWQEFAELHRQKLPGLLHINTGMNRLGMPDQEITKLINRPDILQAIDWQYIMSHLSASEESTNPYNVAQLKKFTSYLKYFPKVKASLANSSSMFLGAEYHFDLIRSGAALYGLNPTPTKANPMHQPIKLTAPIIQIQELPVGSAVGYNMTFTAQRPTIIATLPIGYADGYARVHSPGAEMFIDGYRVPVVGRISMDLVTIDVTDLPLEKIFLGQAVGIINEYCTIDKIASISRMLSYEILMILNSSRYNKVYKNHA